MKHSEPLFDQSKTIHCEPAAETTPRPFCVSRLFPRQVVRHPDGHTQDVQVPCSAQRNAVAVAPGRPANLCWSASLAQPLVKIAYALPKRGKPASGFVEIASG